MRISRPFETVFVPPECQQMGRPGPRMVWLGTSPPVSIFIVAWFPATMRGDEDPHSRASDGLISGLQVGDQPHLFGDGLDARPDLTALGEEIVVRIDKQERG